MEQKHGVSNYDTFINYRATIIRAVAQAWKDHAFKEELLREPKVALKEKLHYDFPYDMDLSIIDNSATWNPRNVVGWIVNTQNVVTLPLPPKPDTEDEAVALAAFNAGNLTFLTNF